LISARKIREEYRAQPLTKHMIAAHSYTNLHHVCNSIKEALYIVTIYLGIGLIDAKILNIYFLNKHA